MDCVFCRIIRGEIPCHKIFEDDDILAFLDISCDAEGHTLVIPKQHCTDIFDCEQAVLSKVMAAAQRIARHYKDNCGFSGANIFNNSGAAAGQSVFHLHVHVIPRRDRDGADLFTTPKKKALDLPTFAEKNKIK